MVPVIECFYSLSSPWAYFGGPQLQDVARRHHARLVLRPYDFLKVVPQTGGIPLRTRPQARQDYHALELDRWRRYLGIKLNLRPKFYPTDNKPAGHMVIAAQLRGLDAQRLSHAILRALWAEERDIADPAVRREVADAEEMDGAGLLAAETAPETIAEYAKNTEDALVLGVFGAPTYVWNGALYWGQDRLAFLDRDLALAA
jgi:2-hydroxychromene-2-carboxylate isomerase